MKPITLKPEEIKSLASSGRAVIWREALKPVSNGPYPYQPGAEFWVCEKTYPVSTEPTTYQALLCDARTTQYRVRVVSVSPEQRETWGWRVEFEVI